MAKTQVLVVDDDAPTLERVKAGLTAEGFAVEAVRNGRDALARIETSPPDAVVLDITFAGAPEKGAAPVDGIEVLRRIRDNSDLPVIMLSGTIIGAVKVMALTMGADDYLTKPFDVAELAARIRAVLRRARKDEPGERVISFRRVRIDPMARRVWKDGRPVELTAIEFEMLHTLARRPGRVFSREQIIEQAWKYAFFGVPKVVDVHIGHIRRKLEEDPANPKILVTVRGAGYRFEQGEA